MPNWCYNQLEIRKKNNKGAEIEDIIKAITIEDNGELMLDFNKIVPMPKSLDIESSSNTTKALRYYIYNHLKDISMYNYNKVLTCCEYDKETIRNDNEITIQEMTKDLLKYNQFCNENDINNFGEQVFNNIINYGCADWYDWCRKNWGTKWNACDNDIEDNVIHFSTAWCPPEPVISALSQMYPNNSFELTYTEEQITAFGGVVVYENGEKASEIYYEDNCKELVELAIEMGTTCEEDWEFNEETQTYRNIEWDDEDDGDGEE